MNQDNFLDTDLSFSSANENPSLRVKVIGVGGAGLSLVDGLTLDNFNGVEQLAIDVDSRALADSICPESLLIGRRHTRGMGTGGEIAIGRKIAEEEKDAIRKKLEGMDMIFILAGLGGGMGGGATPVIARLAREAGALVFAFAPLPFSWEKSRHAQAQQCLEEVRKFANAVVPLPNDSLLQIGGADATALECFAEAGRNVSKGISAVCSLVFRRGMIDVDFADLRKAFNRRAGRTLFGYGEGNGQDAIREALRELMLCPMLHLPDVSKAADALLILITGGTSMGMSALQQASLEIRDEFKAGEHVVFGAHVDENLGDRVQVVVLGATDLEAGMKVDVAPSADQVMLDSTKAKQAHESKLRRQNKRNEPEKVKSRRQAKKDALEQNTFDFMQDNNQRGIFDNSSRNMYEGEDLDVPAYLRRGVKISL
jgi:cell division protein FtsZ